MPEYEATRRQDESTMRKVCKFEYNPWTDNDVEITEFYTALEAAEAFCESTWSDADPYGSCVVWVRELPATGSGPATGPIRKFTVEVRSRPEFEVTESKKEKTG